MREEIKGRLAALTEEERRTLYELLLPIAEWMGREINMARANTLLALLSLIDKRQLGFGCDDDGFGLELTPLGFESLRALRG